jgi:fanconi anemia-associated protein
LECLGTHKDVQLAITLKKDHNVIPIANMQEVPALLQELAYAKMHPSNNQFTTAKAPPVDAASRQLHLFTVIPNIGRKKAQLLLEKFGHFKRLSYATKEEMASVIGNASANSIYDFFHKRVTE